MTTIIESGPKDAKIAFIGEWNGSQELAQQKPLVGWSGEEFDKMLSDARIDRRQVYCSNLVQGKKPDTQYHKVKTGKELGIERLLGRYPSKEISEGRDILLNRVLPNISPNIIVPLGEVPMWALTGLKGINKWRGSILETDYGKVIPTYNPAAVMRNWPWRYISVLDLRRAKAESEFPEIRHPKRQYLVRPRLDDVIEQLNRVRGKTVTCDIETRRYHVACVGFAFNKVEAFCIPFMSIERPEGYWSPEDELTITLLMRDVMTDPSTNLIFHNGLFDCQYFVSEWGFVPRVMADTMIMQNVAFPGLRKSLDFCASMYCDYYRFWKDDGKEWNPKTMPEEQHWNYNCDDCTYTFEVYEAVLGAIKAYKLEWQLEFQMKLFLPVLKMMVRGVLIDQKRKNTLRGELLRDQAARGQWLEDLLGHPLNPASSPQMKSLFYDDFRQRIIKKKNANGIMMPTLDKDALDLIKERSPLLGPLITTIEELRSINVFTSNYANAKLSSDGRIRSMINIAGTETFRFTNNKDSFGGGCNLQTISSGTEENE